MTTTLDASGVISADHIESLRSALAGDPAYRLARNAVTKVGADEAALNREVVAGTDWTFSTWLDDWSVTNQRKSGRCWMFAALNLFRAGVMKRLNVKKFEFSQNFTLFWDKFERANWFLECIIKTAARELDDRHVAFLLDYPIDDGGQWNMFVNLVRRHGLVPKDLMPETQSSSNTARMNAVLKGFLRRFAGDLRGAMAGGASADEARQLKDAQLSTIWRVLCTHLGEPPASFLWQYNDKDREFHREGMMTPVEFAERYVDLPLADYVCLVHDPRPEHPFGQTYTVEFLGNIVGGEQVVYLNVDTDTMKRAAIETLEGGEPVWFGCDVGKQFQRQVGLWDAELFDYAGLYGLPEGMDKAARLHLHHTAMTHAMLFTGVDVLDGQARRWRVENSWGDDGVGRKGFQLMNDNWFDEYVFEIAAHRSRLPADLQAALDVPPMVLPPWDPMGALARIQG
ncbi:MAG: C1 family peptidase [Phycisphaerales bacterium]|jgi:bleomycin hydrolase|nr:C1 family peptidase [Phycisphaerales bacterium]